MFHKNIHTNKTTTTTTNRLMAGIAFTLSFGMSFRLTKKKIQKFLDVESDEIRHGRWEKAVKGQYLSL